MDLVRQLQITYRMDFTMFSHCIKMFALKTVSKVETFENATDADTCGCMRLRYFNI